MATLSDVLDVYSKTSKKPIAHIVLNGYNISASKSLGKQGAMRSFSVNSGDLWDPWSLQEALILHDESGRQAPIKIAALPAEEDGFGLIEFL